jgi:hypothetical protein
MMRDLPCTVIQGLGDNFDFLVYYSDFRIDDPEAGTSSNGPRGGDTGPYSVQGLREGNGNPAAYCSQGRFQWEWIQPVYSGSNQMQERSPEGVTATRAGAHAIAILTEWPHFAELDVSGHLHDDGPPGIYIRRPEHPRS